MDNDDRPVGHVLTRREALALIGASSMLILTRCSSARGSLLDNGAAADTTSTTPPDTTASGSCVVRPELTEGPYFVEELLNRSDIRANTSDGAVRAGALLELTFIVSSISGSACAPLEGVLVDVWHCDALGVYSDVSDPGFNTEGQDFLRGYQLTDASGVARFTTIYPGWYQGRAVHTHFKIRSDPSSSTGLEFTSQLFFDDTLTDQVHAQQPYAAKGQRSLRNAGDGIYAQGGSQLVLAVAQTDQGYAATFPIALVTE